MNIIAFHGPPYLRIVIYILLILAIRMIIILFSYYFEHKLIKKFLTRIKETIDNGNISNIIKSIHEICAKEKGFSSDEKVQKKQRRNIYSYYKHEFTNLITTADSMDNKYSLSSSLHLFYMRIKDEFSSKLDKVKSIIFFSLLTELYAIVVGLNFIAKSDPYHGKSGITFKIALMMMNEIVFTTGIILIVILFLSLWGYFSIKKKYYFLITETDILVNLIFKMKSNGFVSE